jgi:hypothetical protein
MIDSLYPVVQGKPAVVAGDSVGCDFAHEPRFDSEAIAVDKRGLHQTGLQD